MSDCCSSTCQSVVPKKHICPENGQAYVGVPKETIFHHIKQAWDWKNDEQNYYFCDDPRCDVVYFSENNSVIRKSDVRTTIGIKESINNDALICYCFGVSVKQARENKAAKVFVMKKTKEGICACESRNPSGRCCLKDFPK